MSKRKCWRMKWENDFALNEDVISIYCDLEKACNTTWRVGNLREAELKNYLPKFIVFLKRCIFNVRLQHN